MRPGPLSALTSAVREGHLRARRVTEVALERLEATQGHLNTASTIDGDEALAVADAMDRGAVLQGPLAGAPLLIKDLEDWTGHPTRQGSLTTSTAPATVTAPAPARLLAAGAIGVGKSTLPEFAIEGFTANRLTGVTRNPWHLDYSPGGSSGGAGAALASGSVLVATATDGGGSVRIPASLCGLLGIKPTNGVFGRWPAPDWIDYSTDGCLATASDDLRLLYTVQRGPVHGDPTAPAYAMVNAMTATPPSRLVAATRTSDLGPLPADVDRAFRDAVDAASALFGLPVTWIDPGSLFTNGDPDLDWFTVTTAEHVASLGRDFVEAHWDDFHPATQEYLAVGRTIAIDAYLAARRRRYGYVRALDDLLGTDGLLLTPTVASSGFLADGRLDVDAPVTGLPPQVYSTALQNVTGHPALSVPFGTLATGLPFGLQFTAPRYADLTLLDVADAWERAYPWPRTAPGYTGLDEALGL